MNTPAPEPTFHGLIAPMATPFTEDGAIDVERAVRFARYLLDNGCHGLAPLGTTSEANSLSMSDRKHLVDAIIDSGVPGAQLMPGTGCTAMKDTADLTRHALSAGAGGVLVLPPFYYPEPTEDGLFAYFARLIEACGEQSGRWLYFYNIPQFSTVTVTPELVRRVHDAFPGIVGGLKDSTGNWQSVIAFLDAFPDLAIFPSSEAVLVDALEKGAAGTITAGANVFPQMIGKLYDAWKADGEVGDMQARVAALRTAVQSYELIPAVKALLAHFHDDEAWQRLAPPLAPLSEPTRQELTTQIDRLLRSDVAEVA